MEGVLGVYTPTIHNRTISFLLLENIGSYFELGLATGFTILESNDIRTGKLSPILKSAKLCFRVSFLWISFLISHHLRRVSLWRMLVYKGPPIHFRISHYKQS